MSNVGSVKNGILFLGYFFNMTTPITFLKQTYDELQKVKWPTRDEITRLTIIVIFISIAISLYIGALDFILTKIMEVLLK